MPAYMSHSIMGDELYKQSQNDEKLFRSYVNHESLKSYSLGVDLSNLIVGLKWDAHYFKTQAFLLNIIQYIKVYGLMEDEDVLAFLYGHICHYFFDINAHPLIYYIEKGCNRVGMLDPHTLVEGYIDLFMAENILKEDYTNVGPSFFNKANIGKPEIARLIKEVYEKTYNAKNAVNSYKLILQGYALLKTCTYNRYVTEDILSKVASFEKFLEVNNLTRDEIINQNKDIWRVPITGEKHTESFIDLYNRALEMAMYAIAKVNEYLYDGKSLSSLYDTFPNVSYDTGVDLSLGYTFKYTRRK